MKLREVRIIKLVPLTGSAGTPSLGQLNTLSAGKSIKFEAKENHVVLFA